MPKQALYETHLRKTRNYDNKLQVQENIQKGFNLLHALYLSKSVTHSASESLVVITNSRTC